MPEEVVQTMRLKKLLTERDEKVAITDEDVSKLEYVQEEIQGIIPE
ncbi:MAG: hypothetical protein JRF08_05340 [Deltaproteobacteria bacterium]|nr:hypothetical protein [Deltaproteobacteria bacterium]